MPLHVLLPGPTMLIHFALSCLQPLENHSISLSSVKCPYSQPLCARREKKQNTTEAKPQNDTEVLLRLLSECLPHCIVSGRMDKGMDGWMGGWMDGGGGWTDG